MSVLHLSPNQRPLLLYLLANQRPVLYLWTNQKLVLPEQRAKEGEEEDEGQQWSIQVHGQGLLTNPRSVLSLSTNES